MQLGVIGMGRMGANIARRLMRGGHQCVVWDRDAKAVGDVAKDGATAASDPADLVAKLEAPRAVWVMLPAGGPTEETVTALGGLLKPGDIVIDGGNTFYRDDIRRAKALAEKEIRYVDVGTSGGVWGLERGYCMMVGGEKAAVDRLDPILKTLAPGLGDVERTKRSAGADPRPEQGYMHAGPAGVGPLREDGPQRHRVRPDAGLRRRLRRAPGQGHGPAARGRPFRPQPRRHRRGLAAR